MDKNLLDFLDERYTNREDKGNIYGVGITDGEFVDYAIEYLLGKDWYVVDPLGRNQINEIALQNILLKHSTRYRKEHKKWLKTIGR